MLVRNPCKNLKSYDNPLCQFSNGGNKNKNNKKSGKIPKIVAYGAFDETVCTAPLGPKDEESEGVEEEDDQRGEDQVEDKNYVT